MQNSAGAIKVQEPTARQNALSYFLAGQLFKLKWKFHKHFWTFKGTSFFPHPVVHLTWSSIQTTTTLSRLIDWPTQYAAVIASSWRKSEFSNTKTLVNGLQYARYLWGNLSVTCGHSSSQACGNPSCRLLLASRLHSALQQLLQRAACGLGFVQCV